MMEGNEKIVRQIILNWAAAISANDRKGILLLHSKNLLMYDFVNIVHGIDDYDATWDFFFAQKIKQIRFDVRELEVTAGDTVAFATCLIRCEGTSGGVVELRLTVGLKKIDNEWIITHEHHSVPSTNSKFIEESDKK